jgi:hypothetical protein
MSVQAFQGVAVREKSPRAGPSYRPLALSDSEKGTALNVRAVAANDDIGGACRRAHRSQQTAAYKDYPYHESLPIYHVSRMLGRGGCD